MTIALSESLGGRFRTEFWSFLKSIARSCRDRLRQRRADREAREAFTNLTTLDHRILDDIGVTREEVLKAASLPLEVNAALALREQAQLRRNVVV